MSILSAVFCQALPMPSNGRVEYSTGLQSGGYTVGTVVHTDCNSGYIRLGSRTRTCEPSGRWLGWLTTCIRSKKSRYYVHKLRYLTFCFSQIKLILIMLIHIVTCAFLPSPSNGGSTYTMNAICTNIPNTKTITCGRYPVNTVVSFTCNYGYSLEGFRSRTCQNSGHWNKQYPRCRQSNINTFK